MNFIEYIQQNPKLFAIAKSDICIGLLKILSKQGLPISEIQKKDYYSKYEEKDLKTILKLLVQIKLLDVDKINHKKIYFANKNTKTFLEIYEKEKQKYKID